MTAVGSSCLSQLAFWIYLLSRVPSKLHNQLCSTRISSSLIDIYDDFDDPLDEEVSVFKEIPVVETDSLPEEIFLTLQDCASSSSEAAVVVTVEETEQEKFASVCHSILKLNQLVQSPNLSTTSPFSSILKLDMILVSAIDRLQELLNPEIARAQSEKVNIQNRIKILSDEILELESNTQSKKEELQQLRKDLKGLLKREEQEMSNSKMEQKLQENKSLLLEQIEGPPLEKKADRCLIEHHGLIGIVSSFEEFLHPKKQTEKESNDAIKSKNVSIDSAYCSLLKEIGVGHSNIEKIEAKLALKDEEDGAFQSMMIEWSQNLLVDQIIDELDGLVDAEEASRLLLSLQMISKGLEIVRLPHWMIMKSCSHDKLRDDSSSSKEQEPSHRTLVQVYQNENGQQQESRDIISLMNQEEIFLKDPTSEQRMIKHLEERLISPIQLLMRIEELFPALPISSSEKGRMKKFLKSQRRMMFEELEEQVVRLQAPTASPDSEDKYICLFIPTSAPSGLGATRIKYLSTQVGVAEKAQKDEWIKSDCSDSSEPAASDAKEEQIFQKVQFILDEIEDSFGDRLIHGPPQSQSLPLASKWEKLDQYFHSTFEAKGKIRPKKLTTFEECLKITKLKLQSSRVKTVQPDPDQLLHLRTIPPEIGLLLYLETLDFRNNQLESIPPEIGRLVNLQTLHLENNLLESIPSEIGQLVNLRALHLESNQLESIPTEIDQLVNLNTLVVQKNLLQSLPPEIGSLVKLQSLDASHNHLKSLPPEIGSLAKLQSLDISHNHLKSVPPEIDKLGNLENMRMNNNRIVSLPPQIGSLLKLQTLCVEKNKLKSLPSEIWKLIHLQILDVHDNQLDSFIPEICRLVKLQCLNFQQNQLQLVPPEISQLLNLQTLNLQQNQLNSIPPEIGMLKKLQSLSFQENRLTSVPCEIGQLENLQTLNLYKNQIQSLPIELGQLGNIQTLHLQGNQLESIPSEIGNLQKLQTLNLHSNKLKLVPPELGQLLGLQTLNLQYNASLGKDFKNQSNPIYSRMMALKKFSS